MLEYAKLTKLKQNLRAKIGKVSFFSLLKYEPKIRSRRSKKLKLKNNQKMRFHGLVLILYVISVLKVLSFKTQKDYESPFYQKYCDDVTP